MEGGANIYWTEPLSVSKNYNNFSCFVVSEHVETVRATIKENNLAVEISKFISPTFDIRSQVKKILVLQSFCKWGFH